MRINLPPVSNVSVMFSGGADSALLLYLLALNPPKCPLRAFSFGQSSARTVTIILPILKEIERLTGVKYPYTHLLGKQFIRPAVDKIMGMYAGVVLTGCNKVLTEEFTPTIHIEGDTPPVRGSALNSNHIRPFMDMDKAQIIRLYKDYDILHLLSKTRSCGIEGLERCGGCYFCMERAWGCEQNGVDDINNVQPLNAEI